MVESSAFKFHAQFAVGVAAVLALPAAWSLFSAIYSAVTTGQVLVISLGRTETARQLVPWPYGWARFVAPPLLIASLIVWSNSAGRAVLWWGAAAGCTVASVLLLFSLWFVSLSAALVFMALLSFVVVVMLLGRFAGRGVAIAFIFASVAVLVWRVVHHA